MRIRFNGQDYEDVDSMPEDVRQDYLNAIRILGDKNSNGIPDFAEQSGADLSFQKRIVVNGVAYSGLHEMPEAVRRLYDQVQTLQTQQGRGSMEACRGTGGLFPADMQKMLFQKSWTFGGFASSRNLSGVFIFALSLSLIVVLLLWGSGVQVADISRIFFGF
jgi:hypothetical protein